MTHPVSQTSGLAVLPFILYTLYQPAIRSTSSAGSYADVILSGRVVILSLVYGLISTVCSYYCYYKGLSMVPETSKVPVFASIETIVAAFIGIFYFHEEQSLISFLGMALVISSIFIMNLWKAS